MKILITFEILDKKDTNTKVSLVVDKQDITPTTDWGKFFKLGLEKLEEITNKNRYVQENRMMV